MALRLVIGGDSKGGRKALSDLGKQFDATEKKASGWGKVLKGAQQGAAVGLVAIAGVVGKGVQSYETLTMAVAALQRQSKISAEDASLLTGQWARYGVSAEAGSKATMMLSKQIDAANIGTKTSIDTFARLGITLDDLKTMSPYQVLEQVRSTLSKMPVGAERTAISAKLMGKGFMSMSKWIAASSTDLDALNQQLRDSGQVMDAKELAKAKDDLKEMALLQVDLRGLLVEVGRSAMPIVRDLVPGLKKLLAVVKPLAPHLVEIGGALAAFLVVSKVATGLNAMKTALVGVKTLLVGGKLASGLADVATAGGVLGGGAGTGKVGARVFSVGASGAASTTIGTGERTVATSLLPGVAGGATATTFRTATASFAGSALKLAGVVGAFVIAAEVMGKLYGDKALKPGAVVPPGERGGAGMYKWSGGADRGRQEKEAKAAAEAALKVKAAIDGVIARLGAKSAVQTGAAFRSTMLQMTQIRELAAKKIVLGDINAKHTDSQLRTARDRIVSALGITVKQADRLMGQMFKDWRPQNQLVPKIDRAAVAVENRIALLRKRAARDVRMGNLDATQMINEISRVSAALGGVRGGARTAGDAVINALKGHAGGGGSYRGHFAASGAYVRRTPGGTLLRVGEGKYDEVVAQVLPGKGEKQSSGGETHLHFHVAQVIGTDERAARQLWNSVKQIAMSDMRMKMAMSRG